MASSLIDLITPPVIPGQEETPEPDTAQEPISEADRNFIDSLNNEPTVEQLEESTVPGARWLSKQESITANKQRQVSEATQNKLQALEKKDYLKNLNIDTNSVSLSQFMFDSPDLFFRRKKRLMLIESKEYLMNKEMMQ